jgi:hypothetical protein
MSLAATRRFLVSFAVAFLIAGGTALACFIQVWIDTSWDGFCTIDGTWHHYTSGYWQTIQTNCGGGGHPSG